MYLAASLIDLFQSTPDYLNRENRDGHSAFDSEHQFQSTPDYLNRENAFPPQATML